MSKRLIILLCAGIPIAVALGAYFGFLVGHTLAQM